MGGTDPSATAAPTPPRRRRTLSLDSGLVFLITLSIQVIGYIPTHFLARGLGLSLAGQALFGTIQAYLLFATSVSNLGDLRIGSAYTFFVSRGEPPGDATTTYLVIRLAMVSGAGAVLFALAPHIGIPLPVTVEVFAVWMIFPILWSTSTIYASLWTSLGDASRGVYPQLVESIVRAGALTFVALFVLTGMTHGAATPTSTLWAMTGAYALGAIASTVVSVPSLFHYRGRFRRFAAQKLFRWSWPLMGSMALLYLSGNLVSLVVIPLLGTQEFNVFNSANAFRVLALSLPSAIAVPLFPFMSSLHKGEAFQSIRSRTWQTLRFTAILVVPGVLALVVYRVNILYIVYSGPYVAGSTALALLAISAIPAALSQLIATTMTSIGRTRLELYITSVQVASLVVGCLLLVNPARVGLHYVLPGWASGISGAAIAVLASSVGAFALNLYFLWTLLGVRVQLRPIATIVLSSIASFVAVSRLNTLIPVNRYYQLAAGILLGFAVYLVVLSVVGELAREDVDTVVTSLGFPASFARVLRRFCWREASPPVNPMPAGGAKALVPLEAEWASLQPPETKPPEPPRS